MCVCLCLSDIDIIYRYSIYIHVFMLQLLVCIAIVLSGANLYGYVKCKTGHGKQLSSSLTSMTSDFIRRNLIQNVCVHADSD